MAIHFKGGNFRPLEKWPHTKPGRLKKWLAPKKSQET